MHFNTSNKTFRELLGNGLSFTVPPFQRDYSWTEDEWKELWQDARGLVSPDPETAEDLHYLGYLVLQSDNSKEFVIIDGQQRLTTLSLLLLAGISCFDDMVKNGIAPEDNRERSKLYRGYIGYVDPVSLTSRPKLTLNRNNNFFYQTYLVRLDTPPTRKVSASCRRLTKAFEWFKKALSQLPQEDAGKDLATFLGVLLEKFLFTTTVVSDELNAFKVFETLNSRGVRLSANDLLKNYLFSVVSSKDEDGIELKALEDRWDRISDTLGKEDFSNFLRVFWNSSHSLVRMTNLFRKIRDSIKTKSEATELIKDIDQYSDVYAALLDCSDERWNEEEKIALRELQMYGVRQPFSLLIASYRQFFSDKRNQFTSTVKALSVISFRYNVIGNLQPQEQEDIYNKAAIEISSGRASGTAAIMSILKPLYPNDDSFKSAFATKEFRTSHSRNRKIVHEILIRLNKQLGGAEASNEAYSIEHILPKNADEQWEHIEEDKQEQLLYRLGNMTLLESKVNKLVGNSSFKQKRGEFAKSALKATSDISKNFEEWDEDAINRHQNQMAKLATAIWRISSM
jgi:hypothetical protein